MQNSPTPQLLVIFKKKNLTLQGSNIFKLASNLRTEMRKININKTEKKPKKPRKQWNAWTHTLVMQLDIMGWPTCIGYAGIIITGAGCICGAGWMLTTLMTVGLFLSCRNSRCSWHQPHQTQKQDTAMSWQREPFEVDCKKKKCVKFHTLSHL